MKLIIDDNILIILGNFYLKDYNLNDYNEIEKNLFKILKKHTIELNGYYNVFIYQDKNYGLIIDMQKENLEYLDYFNNQIELNIEIIEDSFLYEIDDIFTLDKTALNQFTIYQKNYKFYLEVKEKINTIKLGKVLENSKIIYGKKAKKIKRESKIIKVGDKYEKTNRRSSW